MSEPNIEDYRYIFTLTVFTEKNKLLGCNLWRRIENFTNIVREPKLFLSSSDKTKS